MCYNSFMEERDLPAELKFYEGCRPKEGIRTGRVIVSPARRLYNAIEAGRRILRGRVRIIPKTLSDIRRESQQIEGTV